jgi:hypothetical protein
MWTAALFWPMTSKNARSYPDHTLGMMRIIPLLCYTVLEVGELFSSPESRRARGAFKTTMEENR